MIQDTRVRNSFRNRSRLAGIVEPKVALGLPTLVSNATAYDTATVPVPAGTINGDLLVACSGTRNGVVTTASGWTRISHNDAYTSEWNDIHIKMAFNEPASYTFPLSAGQVSWVVLAFRGSGSAVLGTNWVAGGTLVPPSACMRGGVYIAVTCDANSGTHITEHTGLVCAGSIVNSNASVFVSYLVPTDNIGTYGNYVLNANPGYDGTASVGFGSRFYRP